MMKKKKWLAWSVIIVALLIIATITTVVSVRALAFDDYYVSEDNSFSVKIIQNKASSTATIKYETVNWYLFPMQIEAAWSSKYDGQTINASFYSSNGISLGTANRSRVDDGTYYHDTYAFTAEQIMTALKTWYDTGSIERDDLKSGITLYASRPLRILKNGSSIGTVYSYPEMESFSASKGIDWSGKSWSTFKNQTYDKAIHVTFQSVPFTIQVVDENGNEIAGHSGTFSEFPYTDIYYGEKITNLSYPGKITNYEYTGWELSAGNNVISSGGAGSTKVSYTAKQSDIKGNEVVLTFKYKEAKSASFETPTPEPTKAPGATATPTPTPTATPVPASPTPTSQPTANVWQEDNETRYYSTDAGHWIGEIKNSSSYYLASEGGATGSGTVGSSSYITGDKSYLVGTDSNGNQWYFRVEETGLASFVHPKKYNGYEIDSSNIKYITELVFPSTITYAGTAYKVISIGGGGAMYKSEAFSSTTYVTYDYWDTYGYNYYDKDTYAYGSDGSLTQYTNIHREIEYCYGVIGNGYIKSNGQQSYQYLVSGGSTDRINNRNYYVYNTTLKKIVLPNTVTKIEDYAFQWCQALETIEGGAGLANIARSAFKAESSPEIQLSRNSSSGTETIKDLYYYNNSYSLTTYTDTMLAWRATSFLCDEMNFPTLPVLRTIGTYAFAYHYNLSVVDLSESVKTIGASAFTGCKLDRIRIPNVSTSIDEGSSGLGRNTLGTKGYDKNGNTTEIHCEPESTAMAYGLKYDGYYVLYCGYPVTYEPNGAPGTAKEEYSALNIHYGTVDENGTILTYPNYQQRWDNQYSYSSSACQYQSYLDTEGVLWRLDTTNNTMTQVSPGTVFTELFQIGSAHFAYDTSGNLWVSGQQRDLRTYTDSYGDRAYYSSYSTMFNWRKITLPAGTVKKQLTDRGIIVLDSNGVLWYCELSTQSNRKICYTDVPAFVDFAFTDYTEDADDGNNAMLVAITADGTAYLSYDNGYRGFYLGSYLQLYASDFYTSATGGGKVGFADYNGLYGFAVLTSSGSIEYYNYVGTKQNTYTTYSFVSMEQITLSKAYWNTNVGLLLKDASGNTYLAYATDTNALRFVKVASAGVGIKDYWISTYYWSSWTDSGADSYDYYHPRLYIWTTDGYLTVYTGKHNQSNSPSWLSNTSWKAASVKFSKIVRNMNDQSIFAIATDGTLWSGGKNDSGQLGNPNLSGSFGYYATSTTASQYLKQTSTRTYKDVYAITSTTYAMGTDGKIYIAGYYSKNGSYVKENSFTIAENQTWPVTTVSVSERNFITGYDYKTFFIKNPFTYPTFDFQSWNTAADGSGTTYYPGDTVDLSAAMTVYAQWGRPHTIIHYDRNGGNGTMPNTIKPYDTTSITLAKNAFGRTGYKFTGWNTEADGSGTSYPDEGNITVSKGSITTLYAQWEAEDYISTTFSYTLIYMKYPYGTAENVVWKTKSLSYETVETVEGQPYTPASGYTVTYNINKPANMSTVPTALDKTSDSTGASTFNKWRLYRKNTAGEYAYAGSQYSPGSTLSKLTQENGAVVYLYPSWNPVGSYVVLPYTEADGYIFDGWSESADRSSGVFEVYPPEDAENVGIFSPQKDTVLYGVWTPLQYPVTLDGQGADNMPQTSVTMTFDAKCPAVTVPTRDKYVFQGYFTEPEGGGTQYYKADGTSEQFWRIHDGSVTTLYAYWKPASFVNTLYHILGGFVNGEGKNFPWDNYNYLIKAQEVPAEYGETQTIDSSDFVTVPNGYEIWHIASGNLNDKWTDHGLSVEFTQPAWNVNFTIDYKPVTYSITYNLNGGTNATGNPTSYNVLYGVILSEPTRANYIFEGWYLDANFTPSKKVSGINAGCTAEFADIDEVYEELGKRTTGNLTLYANWVPDKAVIYDANGGTGTMATTLFENGASSAVLSKNAFTKTGYHFSYWCQTTASCSGEDASGHKHWADGATITGVTGKVTLYAQWAPNEYKITLDPNGGENNTAYTSPLKVYYETTVNNNISQYIPTPPVGHSFIGWYTEKNNGYPVYLSGGNFYYNSAAPDCNWDINGLWVGLNDITAYAHWAPKTYSITLDQQGATKQGTPGTAATFGYPMPSITKPEKQFTVTYDANGGSCAKTSDTSTYTFGGYFTEPKGKGEQYYTSTPSSYQNWNIDSSATLYAYWPDGGVVLPTPTKSGYQFGGWSTDSAGNNIVGTAGDTYYPEANVKLYAIWTVNSFSLTLNGNGGTIGGADTKTLSVTYQSGTNSSVSSYLAERTGYAFTGYNTKADGSGITVYGDNGGNTNDGTYWKDGKWVYLGGLTVYAQWEANTYSLSYDLVGNKTTTSTTPQIATVPPATAIYDKEFTVKNPTRTGYTFLGWNISNMSTDCTHYYGSNTTKAATLEKVKETVFKNLRSTAGTVKFAAQWENKTYTVTLDLNATGANPTAKIAYTEFDILFDTAGHIYGGGTKTDYLKSNLPTRTGYTFAGWYTAASGGTKVYNADGSITKEGTYFNTSGNWVYPNNATLYAHWEANSNNVDFDLQPVEPSPSPSPTPMPTVVPVFDEDMPPITPPTQKFTVTYDANGGTCSTTFDTAAYIFGGFFTGKNGTGTKYYNADGTSARKWDLTEDTTLYAKWTSVSVKFPTPTRTGYTFQGWYTQASDGTLVGKADATYTPTSNITVYAQWKANTYNVGFDVQIPDASPSPTPMPTVVPIFDKDMPTPIPTPTRKYTVTYDANGGVCSTTSDIAHYTFGGFFTEPDGKGTQYYKADGSSARKWDIAKDTTLYAKWTSTSVKLPTPTRTGYTFQGWYTAKTNGTKAGSANDSYTPTKDIVLYAIWKANSYEVTLEPEGGEPTPAPTVIPTFDKSMPSVTPPTRDYTVIFDANGGFCTTASLTAFYDFLGYFTEKEGTGIKYYNANGTSAHTWDIPQDTTLYAHWKENSITLPTPTRTGYTFKGWYTATSNGTKIGMGNDTYIPTKDRTVYAIWEANTYKVEYDVIGNKTGATSSPTHTDAPTDAVYNVAFTVSNPTRRGYTFLGWNITGMDNCTHTYGSTTTTATSLSKIIATSYKNLRSTDGTVKFYAEWSADTHKVTLNANNGTNNSAYTAPFEVTYDSTANSDIKTYAPTRTGYTFAGWYTAATGGTQIYNAEGYRSNDGAYWKDGLWYGLEDVTLYAHWEVISYKVTLNANTGTNNSAYTEPFKVTYDATTNNNISQYKPSKLGYTFVGWNTKADGSGVTVYNADGACTNDGTYFLNSKWHYTGNVTLYAQWTANTYSILYDLKGNYPDSSTTPVLSSQPTTGTYDSTVTLPNPTMEGYTFTGWTITGMDSCTHTYGSKTTTKTSLSKVFETTFKNLHSSTSGKVTFTATWEANDYTITLEPEGGKPTPAPTVIPTFDKDMPKVNVPTREYAVTFDANTGECETTSLVSKYIFGGYFTGKNGTGTQYYDKDGASVIPWNIAKNTTLYAKWTSAAVTLPTPVKTGYTFQGWYTAKSGGTKIGNAETSYTPTADITLYAQWTANTYSLSYDMPGNKATGTTIPQIATTPPVTATYDKTFTVSNPTRTGYTFLGWNISGMDTLCTHYYGSNTTTAATLANIKDTTFKNLRSTTGTVTFTAQWNNNQYEVTLDLNADGADPAAGIKYSKYNVVFDTAGHIYGGSTKTNYLASNLPERIGYTFTGWYTKATGGTKVYNADGSITKEGTYFNSDGWWVYPDNITLYAQWTPNVYKLSYDLVGNKTTASTTPQIATTPPATATYDKSFTVVHPTRTGYTFLGWNISGMSNNCKHYHGFTTITETTTTITETKETVFKNLHSVTNSTVKFAAQWKNNTYTVTLNLNATGADPAATITHNSFKIDFDTAGHVYGGSTKTDYLKSNIPTRIGYTFTGWYTAATGGTKVYNADGSITKEGTYFDTDGEWVYPNNVTFYAQWTPNVYKLSYDLVGNKTTASTTPQITPQPPATATYDKSFTMVHPTRVGYTFLGWNISGMSNNCKHYHGFTTIAETTTTITETKETVFKNLHSAANSTVKFAAQWKNNTYTVTLDLNAVGADPAATISHNSFKIDFDTAGHVYGSSTHTDYLKSNVPIRIGYTFMGWYTAASGGTKVYNADGSITKEGTYFDTDGEWVYPNNVTFYAQWTPNVYKLSYDLVGNKTTASTTPQITPQPPATATYDKSFTVVHPTRVGYTFLGWDIGGMSNDCKHYYGSYSTTLTVITKTKETIFKNLHSTTNSTVKFMAQWQNNTYTVTLNTNAAGANPAAKLSYDSFKIDFDTTGHVYGGSTRTDYLKSNVPTRTGYTFQGWYTAATGGTKVYNADGSITKEGTYFDTDGEWVYPNNVTFYAQWTPNNYNITINGNKGNGSSAVKVPYSPVRLTFDSTNHYYNGVDHNDYLAGNLASRPGYTFQGYYTAASGGVQLYTSTGAIANSGTVTYPGYESGYYFYQNKYKYAGNLTIYAQWAPITYTIAFDLNDPDAIPVAKMDYESISIVFDTSGHIYGGSTKTNYLASNLPSRIGYTFLGFYTAASGGTKIYNADGSITKEGTYFDSAGRYVNPNNVTLYAHWQANKYTLTLDGNKGLGTTAVTVPYSSVTMTYDSTNHYYNSVNHSNYLAGNLASRIGYTFQGYFTKTDGGTKIYNADGSLAAQTIADSAYTASLSGYYFHTGKWKVANNITMYAQWKPNSYNVVFDARGGRFDYSGSKSLNDMTIHEFASIYNNTTNYPKEFTYTFIFDDKISNGTRVLADGTTTKAIAIPVKTGYKFGGYYTQVQGQGIQVYDGNGNYCYSANDAFNYVGTSGGFKWADLTRIYAYWIPTEDDVDTTSNPYVYPVKEYSKLPEELADVSGIIGVDMTFDVHDAANKYDTSQYIPTTESLAMTGSIASHLLLYQFEADMDRTPSTFIYNVTVPCTIQYVDAATEELVILETSIVETVEVPSYATQYTLSKFALFELEDLRIGSESVLEDIKYAVTNAATISCKEEADTTSVVEGKVYTYTCGNITIRVYDDHSSTTGYAKDIHANSLYNAKSEYNKGYFIATNADGTPQSGTNLAASACKFDGITYAQLVNIIANNTGVYIGGNTKSDSITIQTASGEVVIGGTKDAVTSNECLAAADVTLSGEQAVFPMNGRALNSLYELEYIAKYKTVSDFAAYDNDTNDSAAKNLYKTRYNAMKAEAFAAGQTAYQNAVTSNDVSFNIAAGFGSIEATLKDGDTIKVHTPVASNSIGYNISLSDLYTEITITPDNMYQGTNYLYSRSQKLLLNKKNGNGITNGLLSAPQNVVCFPFDVWDKATGVYYAAGTTITLGATYNADGTPATGTTFYIPASINTETFTYATAAVASNAPDEVLALNNLFVKSANTLYRNELISSYFASKTNRDLATLNPGESIDDKYIAFSASNIKLNSSLNNDRLVVSGEAVDDMYANSLDYMYMGEMVNYYLDTSGSFADANCKVEITPKYLVDGNPIDMYYGFIYNATVGLISPVVKVGEDQSETIKYVTSPTDYERELREELLDPAHTIKEDFWQVRTQSFMELTSMARFFRDIRSEVNPALESLLGKHGYKDGNNDNIADNLQKSQARWYGEFNVQPDMMFVAPGMKIGYCTSCADHHCSTTDKCSVCGSSMSDVKAFDLREYQAFLVYTENHTDFLTTSGYLTVTFDVKITDCDGNVIVRENIPVYTDRGDLITLKYKIGTKAGDKWEISY